MINAGLVLEGGGLRGIYTAGVLDFFMDKEIMFNSIIGVSAGACHATSYIAGQRGRAYRISTDYLEDKGYCSMYSLVTTGDMFGIKMCYDDIPNKLDPIDYAEFERYKGRFFVAATDCITGQAKYFRVNELHKGIVCVRASSSLPLVSRMFKINGVPYLDGGVADSIPLKASIDLGSKKNVVVLTRCPTYEKEKTSLLSVAKVIYGKKYPALVRAMAERHIVYNETLEFIREEQRRGNIFVIQPQTPPDVGRTEKNPVKLRALYQRGYDDAQENYEKMMDYLNK